MSVAIGPEQVAAQKAEHEPQPAALKLSPSVQEATRRFPRDERIPAARLVGAILALHSEYAGGRAARLALEPPPDAATCTAAQWLAEVRTLFDPDRAPELHGRLTIAGLCLLEPWLRAQFERDGALAGLIGEIKERFAEVLTKRGRELYEPPDSVPNQPDNPLLQAEEDRLDRGAFAEYLARRIALIAEQEQGAYAIHLYGPWGSGKTTLLNFLSAELGRAGWLVVDFNAWRNQQIRPPWWALYERVFQASRRALPWWLLLPAYWWRITTGRLHYLVGGTVLAWAAVLLMATMPPGEVAERGMLPALAGLADNVGKILALLLTVWTIVQATNRSLLFGSAQAARSYTDRTSDPMDEICRHFIRLVTELRASGRRLAIFIDDLDRCQCEYVVELLEGMQTVFRQAPVIFVVAADRQWLNACFEAVYDRLKGSVHMPGKPLGALFLEKTFQLTTSVPGVPERLKEAFWRHLIQVEARTDGRATTSQMLELVHRAPSDQTLMRLVEASRELPYEEQREVRRAAVVQLADPGTVKRTEHALRPLARLLEPNPRAMKRLVNAYSAYRALALLCEVDIPQAPLARWTILSLRWPRLADYLEEHPQQVEQVGAQQLHGVPSELHPLFTDPEVIAVVAGDEGARLDRETVRLCALLRG
ncbi:MAG TPA: P-loop NTPase fold protein [Roseiflexaceae bacterium]|nr:P-loop NTPase fold protein [Roseiflexaceae bacterium]